MPSSRHTHQRLPRNFHKTFIPERQYINAMLQFAAAGRSGDYQGIAAATGIPMGTSTGKVPAILDYCRGMWLLELKGADRSAVKHPELTPFGRAVLFEDHRLSPHTYRDPLFDIKLYLKHLRAPKDNLNQENNHA